MATRGEVRQSRNELKPASNVPTGAAEFREFLTKMNLHAHSVPFLISLYLFE